MGEEWRKGRGEGRRRVKGRGGRKREGERVGRKEEWRRIRGGEGDEESEG
ncbi:hypothetical protein ACJ7K1_13955 [Paenibacillus elgii]